MYLYVPVCVFQIKKPIPPLPLAEVTASYRLPSSIHEENEGDCAFAGLTEKNNKLADNNTAEILNEITSILFEIKSKCFIFLSLVRVGCNF